MRSFADLDALIGRVPARVVTQLSAIDFGRGSEALYRGQMPGLLIELADRARVQSITASSAIEGVVVADAGRAERIINRRTSTLRNRSEQELAGYRDAQDYLFQQDWRPLNAGLILHLHRLLFAHTAMPGGAFKTEDNLVVDRSPDGSTTVRFKPVPAARTPLPSTTSSAATTRRWPLVSTIPSCSPDCSSSTSLSSTPLRTATGGWPAFSPAPCSPTTDTPSDAT